MPADVAQAQRLRVADEDAQEAAPAGEVADRAVGRLVDPGREEPLELPAVPVEDAERRITGPGQLASCLEDPQQHGFVIEFGDDLAADLEQPAECLGAEMGQRVAGS